MDSKELSWLESIILGAIQGLTEFLPVSSDGHLVLGRYLLDYQKDILVFDVLLHLGTFGSLLFVFHKDLRALLSDSWKLLFEILKSKKLQIAWTDKYRPASFVWITTFVTGLVGLLAEDFVEQMFASMQAASTGFLITSAFLFVASWRSNGQKSLLAMPWFFPLVLGLSQSMALLPGVSRSGLTIATALLFALNRRESGNYSFLVAIPIIFLASIYQARHLLGGEFEGLMVTFAGMASSFIVGIFALKLLLWMLNKQNLYPFAVYTLILGVFGWLFL